HNIEWYANGPEPNYVDRANGARLSRFTNRIEDNVDAYSVPQEYANRTGVRDVAITNDYGDGIRIIANKSPLECSVSPYNAFEMENAKHYYELPKIHLTVVTVTGKLMDLGGDDYLVSSYTEEFRLQ